VRGVWVGEGSTAVAPPAGHSSLHCWPALARPPPSLALLHSWHARIRPARAPLCRANPQWIFNADFTSASIGRGIMADVGIQVGD
jgi:hypothetical protein